MAATIFDLAGRTALVTGATGHLGRAMAKALAQAGAHVLVNGRKAETCEALAAELRAAGHQATAAAFDVADETAVAGFLAACPAERLDCLVNNAYAGGGGTVETAAAEDYRRAFEVSVVAAQGLLRLSLPRLRAAVATCGDASVINIASMYGIVSPNPGNYATPAGTNPPFYGAAKAALVQFTRYAACEFGAEGIRVNAIAPGPFPAPAVQRAAPEFVARLTAHVPMKRMGAAGEIGGPVVFLASSAASFVNGAVLAVDGGWTSW